MISSIFKKHNGKYELIEIPYARSKSIIHVYDKNNHEITLNQIKKLKKCVNLESVTIDIYNSPSDIIVNDLFNLQIKKLNIRVMAGKINIPRTIKNDKLEDLSISVEDKSELTFIPKEIFELNLKTLTVGGLVVLENPKYFPNLLSYDFIIIMNNNCYNYVLFNDEHEMLLDICSEKTRKIGNVTNEDYFIPETITKLKIKIPAVYNSETKLQNLIIKVMNNLPNSIEILILNLSLPYPEYFQNLPIGLKELHLNKMYEPLLEIINTHFKIPAGTKIKFY